MITLKQLVADQKFTGESDIHIIQMFFEQNDMEEEGMELVQELSKTKIAKLKRKVRTVQEWVSYLPSQYLYETYDLDTAHRLHMLELDYISNGCELSDGRMQWARENLSNIKTPLVYFQPLIEYLDDKGVRFKGEQPIKNKSFM